LDGEWNIITEILLAISYTSSIITTTSDELRANTVHKLKSHEHLIIFIGNIFQFNTEILHRLIL